MDVTLASRLQVCFFGSFGGGTVAAYLMGEVAYLFKLNSIGITFALVWWLLNYTPAREQPRRCAAHDLPGGSNRTARPHLPRFCRGGVHRACRLATSHGGQGRLQHAEEPDHRRHR